MALFDVGTVIAQRFQLESPAGEGGMGAIFRAHDWYTDQTVALKMLRQGMGNAREVERFQREVKWLEKLRHPGIVGYVAHGRTPNGMLFMAMEWLDGEDLGQRLGRGSLDVRQTLIVAEKVADALAEAHRHNIVHRDIKPSNLFLRDNRLEKITLLDFGIARDLDSTISLTATGAVVGTPEYMAPEQARGSHRLSPSADIFSLGTVLYHCLTGRPPFTGQHVAARLAKLLFEPVPLPSTLRPGIAAPLEDLLMRMLDKVPDNRPGNGAELLAELAALKETHALEEIHKGTRPRPTALTTSEEMVTSVVVASMRSTIDQIAPTLEADIESVEPAARQGSLQEQLEAMGARVEWLADSSLVAVHAPRGNALDQVKQAARSALRVKQAWPQATVSLATGTAAVMPNAAVGEVIDRAVVMVRDYRHQVRESALQGVLVDQSSAALLDDSFELVPLGDRIEGHNAGRDNARGDHGQYAPRMQVMLLVAERARTGQHRRLLGKPTPCVGRDHELGVLAATLDGCIETSSACAVRITAPAGVGKSRLRHEFLRRIRETHPGVLVLVAHGEPLGAGSPYALLGQALRQRCAIHHGEPRELSQQKLQTCVARHVDARDAQRLVEFMGELCNVPFADATSPQLQAARRDPKVMRRHIRNAAVGWLRAECAQNPVLLVFEDLQWGDALSIRLIDDALGELGDAPLMVLALARPEVDELFPDMWKSHSLHQLRLATLSHHAGEALVTEILGQDISPATRERIVNQAGGNALFLEELIRAVAQGKGESLPETVLSMLQARLLGLDADARLVLRAASVFGESFWAEGVRELLGETAGSQEHGAETSHEARDLDRVYERLIEAEAIERHHDSRYPSETEYRFRHALIRDAAYSMLTGDDRTLGHCLAGHYLEGAGEDDPMILAEHARQGNELERAVGFYTAAALQSYENSDDDTALARAEQAVACQAQGRTLGTLNALIAQILFLRGQPADALPRASQALELLSPGIHCWYKAFGTMFAVASVLARREVLAELWPAFLDSEPEPEALGAYIEAGATQVIMLSAQARGDRALPVLERIEAACQKTATNDLLSHAWVKHSRAYYLHFLGNDPFAVWQLERAACPGFAEVGDLRSQVYAEVVRGLALQELGLEGDAEHTLRGACALAGRLMEPFLMAYAGIYTSHFLVDTGQVDEAETMLAELPSWALQIPAFLGHEPLIRGKIYWRTEQQWEQAEAALRSAADSLKLMGGVQLYAWSSLVTFLAERGQVQDARELAERGLEILDERGGGGFTAIPMLVAAAMARRASGDVELAGKTLERALAVMQTRAARIADPAIRDSYCNAAPHNARALALARAWNLPVP